MPLSCGNAGKYEFLTGEDVLPEKGLLEKADIIKQFQYLPLVSKLKKETDIAKRQYQGLDKVYEFDEKKGDETIDKDDKKYNKSDLIYDANHSL